MTHVGLFARRLLPFAVACLTVVGVTAAALAGDPSSRAQVQDPNDTRGLLDVRRVWFEPEADPTRWTIVTFSPWTAEVTRDRGSVFVFLDTMGDPRFDYYALIVSNGRRLSGSLWRDPKRGPDVRLLALDVRRDSDLDVAVRIPLGPLEIGEVRTVYRWSVVTTFTGRVCRATCVDRVPDEGTFEQPIGTPTPTPTATPTGSPTPSPIVAVPR
ncbi:MAG: hypothetical protein ACXWYT_04730 [Actinomycetota bacterium]